MNNALVIICKKISLLSNFRTPTPLVHIPPKFFHPLNVGRPTSKESPVSLNNNQSIKRKHNPRMTIVIRSLFHVGFRF